MIPSTRFNFCSVFVRFRFNFSRMKIAFVFLRFLEIVRDEFDKKIWNLLKVIVDRDADWHIRYGIDTRSFLGGKITKVERPKDKKKLQCSLGLTNFFGRFIRNYSNLVLNDPKKKNVLWEWGESQEMAFKNLKYSLSKSPVVQPFDINRDSTLVCDASEKRIGRVILQDGHPILYISRVLNKSKQNYSNIEWEALAIVRGMNRAKQFLLGKEFLFQNDHKPLEYIFHPRKALPKVTSARIKRWVIQIMAFDFEIMYTKGNDIPHADALSRLRFLENLDDGSEEDTCMEIIWSLDIHCSNTMEYNSRRNGKRYC